MLVIALAMLVILVLAALVVTYAAYPHRGEEVPAAPWLADDRGRARRRPGRDPRGRAPALTRSRTRPPPGPLIGLRHG